MDEGALILHSHRSTHYFCWITYKIPEREKKRHSVLLDRADYTFVFFFFVFLCEQVGVKPLKRFYHGN